MDISYPYAGQGGSTSVPAEAGNGQLFNTDGMIHAHTSRAVYPLWAQDADGQLGAPRYTKAPDGLLSWWEPDSEPQRFNGRILVDQPIRMAPYRSFTIRKIKIFDATAAAVIMQGGIYTAENGGGKVILPPTQLFTNLTGGLRDREVFVIPDIQCEAPYLFLKLEVMNSTTISFAMTIHGDVELGCEE